MQIPHCLVSYVARPLLVLTCVLATSLTQAQTNVALGKETAVSSTFGAAYPGGNAVDGNNSSDASRWVSSGSGSLPQWIEVDLGNTYSVSQFKFWTGKNGVGPYPLYDFALQQWDGATWVDIHSVIGSANTGSVDESFAATVSSNRVRLNVSAAQDSTVRMFELEVYGVAHGLNYSSLLPASNTINYNPGSDLVVTFNAPISGLVSSGIRVEDLTTSTDLSGVTASISGSDLILSHGGLTPNERYAVHLPAGAVSLASDTTVKNGAIYWEFEVALSDPQLASYTKSIANQTDAVDLTFDRDIAIVNAAGITIRRAVDNSTVTGLVPSVSGSVLSISHDAFNTDEAYIVQIDAGAIEGVSNNVGNGELRRAVFAGTITLLEGTFENGTDGFQFAKDLISTAGTENWWQLWGRVTTGTGPNQDSYFLQARTNWKDDYVISPAVALNASEVYTLKLKAQVERTLHVGLSTTLTPDLTTDIEAIIAYSTNGPKTFEFSPSASGTYYLIFYHGDTTANQDMAIDSISLTRAIDPVIRILSPGASSSHLENDSIQVTVEAYALAGNLASIQLFDDSLPSGQVLGSATADGQVYTYTWDHHVPGARTLTATATDSFSNQASDSIPVTITFDDGSLPAHIGYDFDYGWNGWTRYAATGEDTNGFEITSAGVEGGQAMLIQEQGAASLAVSSPQVNLFHGETYTLSFRAKSNDATSSYGWAWLVDEVAGYPADLSGKTNFTVSPAWDNYQYSFTVPYDGVYYLTLFDPTLSGYEKVYFDDIRIIGTTNATPVVTLEYPDSKITTIQGIDLEFSATASDPDGTITKVEFYRDAFKLGEVTSSPYDFVWENVPFGLHNVYARAHDANGATTDTESMVVDVLENGWSIATLLGKSTDTSEMFTGAGYLSDGTLVVGGILDPTLFPGVTPVYLNGSSVGDKGFVALLSEDGTTVQKVVVLSGRVLDLDIGGGDRIYVAADNAGAVVLDATATSVLWNQSYGTYRTHRIDAADDGTFVVLNSSTSDHMDERIVSSTNYVYDTSYTQLGSMGGAAHFTTDVAIDAEFQTVCFIGWKNLTPVEDGSPSGNPVDIPAYKGYAYDGTLKFRGYDWGFQSEGSRWLNLPENNMADTRGSRIYAGADGYFYMGIEFDGGNTPLRYDPFDVTQSVLSKIVGGSAGGNHGTANTTTAPKVFVGRYTADTGDFVVGQWITNRKANGEDNTIRIRNGNITTDAAGRIHVVGFSASGLPISMDHIPDGIYEGGNFHLVYSPDFATDELVVRYSYGGGNSGLPGGFYSNNFAVAISQGGKVFSGGFASRKNFTYNAFQAELSGGDKSPDAYYSVADLSTYYNFQTGAHPRLFFDEGEIAVLREKVTKEPYLSMKNRLISMLDLDDSFRPYDPNDIKEVAVRAQQEAFLYILTGDEAYATAAKANVDAIIESSSIPWADPAVKGLDSYWLASKVAAAYDWCVNSAAWDGAFDYKVSRALKDMGTMIINNGGAEQSPSAASNWQGSRGASGVLALLASDHASNSALIDSGYDRVLAYLNGNLGTSSTTRGWNPEGQGYTYFPNGNYVGPFGIAMARHDPARDIRNHVGLRMAYWSIFAGATSAVDVYNFGGVKPDWSDDNAHIRGEGTYNQAFYYAYDSLKPGIMHMYDRLMGLGSDDVDDSAQKRWDSTRGGAIWGILYYPQDFEAQNPSEIWDWHQAADDSGGMGMFTFRDAYVGDDDFIAQFKTRLRNVDDFAHDAPDGLGFRIIGNANPWVVGGGRNGPGRDVQQASLYTSVPDPLNPPTTLLNNTGTLVGTPLVRPDGGGHVIASMATTNVGVSNHKRWFVANYDSAGTTVDAAYVIADTSTDGQYWQLPTFGQNTVNITGSNTFTITGTNGATMQGTVLYPASGITITAGTMARGSSYSMTLGGSLATEAAPTNDTRVEDNQYIHVNHAGGDFLVVLTVQSSGDTHPTPVLNSGTVADANLDIGSLNLALQSNDVLYNGSAFSAPGVTVTFDAGSGGSITSGNAVQSLAYGAAATEPTLSVNSGYTFVRWDKAFDAVTQTMTVSAVYYDETGNTAPVVDAGSDFSVEVLAGHTLTATVTDDGLPNPRGFVSQNWTQVSGPGIATFNNDSVTAATVSFDLTGTYVLRLTASDGVSQSSDDVTVTVNPIAGPGYLRFVSNSYTVAEDGNTATVDVVRYNGGEGAITVDYATGDSSASAGSDYTTTSGTLSWAAGESVVKQITVAINEDVDVEGDEVLIVSLSNPTGGASVGTISQTGVTITDNDVNVAPSVSFTDPTGSAVTVAVNAPLNLAVSVSDDGQPLPVALTWTKVSGPGGVLFGAMTAASTTATFDTIGNYVIKITAHDGAAGTSLTMGVNVNLDGTGGNNYAPVAVADAATLDEDTYALLDVLANDSDGDAGQTLSLSGFTQPSNGSVTQEGADLLYIPNLGFTGADSFTYTVTDGTDSDIGLVNLTVNDTAEDAYVDFNKALIGDYEDPDPSAGGGTIETLVSYPFNNSGAADRTPGTQATGVTASSVTLHALNEDSSRSNVLGLTAIASSFTDYVAFTVTGINGADLDLNGGTVGMVIDDANGSGKAVRVTLVAGGTSVDLLETTGEADYTYTSEAIAGLPVANTVEVRVYFKASGTWNDITIDNLQVSGAVASASPIGDILLEDAGATLRLDGNGWYTVSKSYTLTANTHLQFEFKADPQGEIQGIGVDDGSSLTLFQLYGTQTLAGMNTDFADYTGSEPNYKTYSIPVGAYRTGDISAIILANDDDAASGANAWFKNVRLVEIGTNSAPVATDDSGSAAEDNDATVSVLANDTDADTGDTLSIDSFTQGVNGTVTQVGDDLIYSPAADFNGADSFTYTVTDGALTATATVNITINAVNDAPVAVDDSGSANEDNDATVSVLANDSDIDSSISIESFTQGTNGTVTQVGNDLVYSPTANFNGADSFSYTITDGALSDTATVNITINAINDAPVAVDDSGSAAEDGGTITISVLTNDGDVDTGDTLSIQSFTQGSNGSVSQSGDVLLYSPDADFNGTDSFTYVATDGTATDTATVNITVTPVNDAPFAVDDAQSGAEDSNITVSVLANDGDIDSSISIQSFTQGSNGTVSQIGNDLVYMPSQDYNGADSFSYTVTDGSLTDSATVSITVTAANDAPVAVDDAETAVVDTAVSVDVLANDTDVDTGDTLTINSFSQGTSGTVTENAGQLVYTPNASFTGSDSFTYDVTDGTAVSNSATVSITVNGGSTGIIELARFNFSNDGGSNVAVKSPSALDPSVSSTDISLTGVAEDASRNNYLGLTSMSSSYSDYLSFTLTADPGLNIDLNGATVAAYLNHTNGSGKAIYFSFISDGTTVNLPEQSVDSHTNYASPSISGLPVSDTIEIRIYTKANATWMDMGVDDLVINGALISLGGNNAPVAVDDSGVADEDNDATVSVLANDTDADTGDTLSIDSFTQGTNGTVAQLGNDLVYSPAADFNGADSFSYTVTDGALTDIATVTITINAVNDAPVAVDDSGSAAEDNDATVSVLANDSDIDSSISIQSFTQGANGSVAQVGNDLVYSPAADFNGADSFTYTVTDGNLTDTATVSITINAVNDAPVAIDDSGSADEDNAATVSILANDSDVDSAISIDSFTQGANGSVAQVGNDLVYSPAAEFSGSDSFTYTLTDGTLTDTATVSITINAVNDAPFANNDSGSADEDNDATVSVLANDGDIDSSISIQSFTQGSNGTVTQVGSDLVYSPAADFNGADSFSYTVTDGALTDTATVSITINAINDAPVAVDDSGSADEDNDATVSVLTNDSDVDTGDSVSIQSFTQGSNGTVAQVGNDLVYSPTADFNGADSFSYTVTDGALTDTATVSITINAVNDAPVAVDDSGSADEDNDATVSVLANDSDVDTGDTVSIQSFTQGTNGTVAQVGNDLVYSPAANFNGTDSFSYTVTDGALTDTATVTITINAINDAPVAVDDSGSADEDNDATVSVLANDSDVDTGDSVSIQSFTQGSNGTVAQVGNDLVYSPAADFNGSDSFTYVVTDGSLSDTAIVNITINAIDDAPVAVDDSNNVNEDGSVTVSVLANDVNVDTGDTLSVISFTQGSNGTVSLIGNNLIYSPSSNFNGSDSFDYTMEDGTTADTATVNITVNPVNDAPVAADDSASTVDSVAVTISVLTNDSDVDTGDVLSIGSFSQGSNGSVAQNGTELVYTPNAGFIGIDSFTYLASDGTDPSAQATVTVTVDPNPSAYLDFDSETVYAYTDPDPFDTGLVTLAEYAFNGSGTTADRTPSTTDPNVTAGTVQLNGLNEDTSRSNKLGLTQAAVNPNDYIETTLSLSSGQQFDFESGGEISFFGDYNNGGQAASSNYFRLEVIAGSTTVTFADAPVYNDATHVFSLAGQGLSGESSVTVRIYLARSASWNDTSLDNLTIKGDVQSIDTLTIASQDAGATVNLQGNGWAEVPRLYTVTANTYLEFEFAADVEAEVHAIGVVDSVGTLTVFQVFGTQIWTGASQSHNTYTNPSAANTVTYSIPIGGSFTGDIDAFILGQDADAGVSGHSWFSNIRLIEN